MRRRALYQIPPIAERWNFSHGEDGMHSDTFFGFLLCETLGATPGFCYTPARRAINKFSPLPTC